MKWNGVELVYKEDWAEAIRGLLDENDAAIFLAAYGREQPFAEEIVGYLTGELPPHEGNRARRLLRVQHPLLREGESLSPAALLALGFSHAYAHRLPAWLDIATSIPRKSPDGVFAAPWAKAKGK